MHLAPGGGLDPAPGQDMENDRRAPAVRTRLAPFVAFLAVACAALAALDVLLVLRNRELTRRVVALTSGAAVGTRPALGAGDAFPPLALLDAHGRAVPLAGDGAPRPVLLFVSSSACDPAVLLLDASGSVRRAFYGTEQEGLSDAVEKLLLGE